MLAGELAARGASVVHRRCRPRAVDFPVGLFARQTFQHTIIGDVTEDSIVDVVEDASTEHQFVIIDLEGTASLMVANAIGMSDLIIIPTQGASMDAKGASKTIKLIRNQARLAKREIPYASC